MKHHAEEGIAGWFVMYGGIPRRDLGLFRTRQEAETAARWSDGDSRSQAEDRIYMEAQKRILDRLAKDGDEEEQATD